MKASEIRELSVEEIHVRVVNLKEALFNLRFRRANDQLEDLTVIGKTKRDIARLKTVACERERARGTK